VLVALAGGVLWHFSCATARARGRPARTRIFPGVEATQIEWVELVQADGVVVRLEKRGEAWRLTKPVDAPADRFAADGAASALADLASETVFDPAAKDAAQHPEAPESYGLTREPRVRFSAAGKSHALRLGDLTPIAGNSYVAADGDVRVFVVPQWQTNALTKPLAELRERGLDADRDSSRGSLAWAAPRLSRRSAARGVAPLVDAADTAVQALIST
jgi:hypothetical protein